MTWSASLNFRSTSGYVTDATGETYVLSTDTYPTTRSMSGGGSSVTFGWELGPSAAANRTKSSPYNPELSGINYVGTAGHGRFRVDLPAAGSYIVRIAFGDASTANTQQWALWDTTTVLITCTNVGTAAGHFIDASLTDRTASAWQSSNTPETETFATTICRIDMNNPSSLSSTLAHFSIAAATSFIAPPGLNIIQAVNRASTY